MNYKIIGITKCNLLFAHSPRNFFIRIAGGAYQSDFKMELQTEQPGPPVFLRFLDKEPENVVVEESTTRIEIHMPTSDYAGFYCMLRDAIYDKKYTVKLAVNLTPVTSLNSAIFEFIPNV